MSEGYPLKEMWKLSELNHKDDVSNLLALAGIALTAPVHTVDCEGGFSSQNVIKTSLGNRISSERLDDLMAVSLEEEELGILDVLPPFKLWSSKTARDIFNQS